MNHLTLPVEFVSWQEAREFCERLSALPEEQNARRHYRLPTEAEWEYACRGGQTGAVTRPFALQTPLAELSGRQANFEDSGRGRTHPVGQSGPANAFGLYDMHGNVWEWCSDWYRNDWYRNRPNRDPQGPGQGEERVLRGGCWHTPMDECRAARRFYCAPDARYRYHGFRIVCEVTP